MGGERLFRVLTALRREPGQIVEQVRKRGRLRKVHGLHRLKIARSHLSGGGFQTFLPAHDVEQFIIIRGQTVVRIDDAGDGPGSRLAGIQQIVRLAFVIHIRHPCIRAARNEHQAGGFGAGRDGAVNGRRRG